MTAFEQVATQVQQLNPEDLVKFREWFTEYSWQQWDAQIEQDSQSGKLKALAQKALADHATGNTEQL